MTKLLDHTEVGSVLIEVLESVETLNRRIKKSRIRDLPEVKKTVRLSIFDHSLKSRTMGMYEMEFPVNRPISACATILMHLATETVEEQENTDADVFVDFLRYRRKGVPLHTLILNDLQIHEDFVDMTLEEMAQKKREIDS